MLSLATTLRAISSCNPKMSRNALSFVSLTHNTCPSSALTSRTATRIESWSFLTVPSSTAPTSNCLPTSRGSICWPLKWNTELLEMTLRPSIFDSDVIKLGNKVVAGERWRRVDHLVRLLLIMHCLVDVGHERY